MTEDQRDEQQRNESTFVDYDLEHHAQETEEALLHMEVVCHDMTVCARIVGLSVDVTHITGAYAQAWLPTAVSTN